MVQSGQNNSNNCDFSVVTMSEYQLLSTDDAFCIDVVFLLKMWCYKMTVYTKMYGAAPVHPLKFE